MLGDHRNNSRDSHEWGFVPRAMIIGKASREAEAITLCTAAGHVVIVEAQGGNADTFDADAAPEIFGYVADGLGAIAITVEP